jgi:hypothetical protein
MGVHQALWLLPNLTGVASILRERAGARAASHGEHFRKGSGGLPFAGGVSPDDGADTDGLSPKQRLMRCILPLIGRHEVVRQRLHEAHERILLCIR